MNLKESQLYGSSTNKNIHAMKSHTGSTLLKFAGLVAGILFSGSLLAQMAIATGETQDLSLGNSYEVVDIAVHANITGQLAEVSVTQTIHNPGNRNMEVEIFFPLPNQGVVQNFVLMVDGQEIPGKLLDKNEARSIYEGIVRRKRDPALMEYVGYGLYKTRVFPIGVGQRRKITVSYSQLCSRRMDMVSFAYPFGTQKFSARALESVSMTVNLKTDNDLKNIYSPSHDVQVKRLGERAAIVKWQEAFLVPKNDFVLSFSEGGNDLGASLISYKPSAQEDGYFMLLASPANKQVKTKAVPKTVIFVLDRSGSMAGKKLEQSKSALEFVLQNLNEGDLFNIIAYDDRIQNYKPELQRYSKDSRNEALQFVNSIQSGGGTNINDALKGAMEIAGQPGRPAYVLFLTDGLPTAGETTEKRIADNIKLANTGKARLFAFGVGYDVNARLLDRLSGNGGGISEYVKPEENIEAKVASFYNSISSPAITGLTVNMTNTDFHSTYPRQLPDIFHGGQLVWVGRYSKAGKTTITIKGKAGDSEKVLEIPAELASHNRGSQHAYLEKLWATRRVGALIDQIDLNGENQELVSELVRISKKYGILTPYTSFLAREDLAANEEANRSREELKRLEEVSGQEAQEQRELKRDMLTADRVALADPVEKPGVQATMKTVGNKTFYWRNGSWTESSLSGKELQSAIQVTRFSEAYFNLARGDEESFRAYLSIDEAVMVKVDGKVYSISK